MTEEYSLIRQENDILHSRIDSLKEERDTALKQITALQEAIRCKDDHIGKIEQELEDSINENIKVYEILASSSTNKQEDAFNVGLESENKQLKEVIGRLYTSFGKEKKQLLAKIEQLESSQRSRENSDRSELSELCGQYRNEIDSLRAQLNEFKTNQHQHSSETNTEAIESLRAEIHQHEELLQINQQLLDEYAVIVENNSKEIEEKEGLLKTLADALEMVNEEKEQKEKELDLCMQKLHQYEKQWEFVNSQSMSSDQIQSNSQMKALLETKTQECTQLSNQLSIREMEYKSKEWELSHVLQCIPQSGMTYSEECSVYAQLLLLSDMSSYLLTTSLSQFKQKTTKLALPLFSSYFHCLLYIAKAADYSKQYLLLIENPFINDSLFVERLQFAITPVRTLLQFCYDFISWQNDNITANSVWNISKDVIASVVILQKYLSQNAYQGDCIWERNIQSLVSLGKCSEIQTQLYLMEYLLQSQLQRMRDQGINEQLIAGIESVLSLFSSCVNTSEVLSHKLQELQSRITEDGFRGIPDLCGNGSNHQQSGLQCVDNHSLWEYIEILKQECMKVLEHCHALARPPNSRIDKLLSNPGDESLLSVLLNECMNEKRSFYGRIEHFYHNLKNVTFADLFSTGTVNPSNVLPEEPSTLLLSEGRRLQEQFETAVQDSVQKRLEELENQAQSAISRMKLLERSNLDLTVAREQLVAQLNKKREALEVKMSSSTETEKLEKELEKKKKECRELIKESSQLKKEVKELKSQPVQRNVQYVSTNQRLMKRCCQNLCQLSIRNQLSELPVIHSGCRKTDPISIPLSVNNSNSLLKEAVQAQIVDLSICTTSVRKEKAKVNAYYETLIGLMKMQSSGNSFQPEESSVLVSSITLPSSLVAPIVPNPSGSVNMLVTSNTAKRIHSYII